MWCRNANKQLSALVDGELTAAQELAVRGHVENCPRCADELSRMSSLVQLTRGIPLETVPEGLYTRTLTRLAYAHTAAVTTAPARRNPIVAACWLWPAFTGAAAAVVIAGLTQPTAPARIHLSRRPATSIPSVAAPAPITPADRQAAQATQPKRSEPRVAEQPSQPTTEASRPVTEPTAASPSVAPAVTRVASVMRTSRPASRGIAGDPRATTSRSPMSPGAISDGGEERVQPDQPERDIVPAPAMADVPESPAEGNVDQPATTEMAATVDPETSMRVAGFTPDGETSNGEDEGAQMLRMYLAERNRTVPQPPAVGMGRRRHTKPL